MAKKCLQAVTHKANKVAHQNISTLEAFVEAAYLIQSVIQDIHHNLQKNWDSLLHLFVCNLNPVPCVAKSHLALPDVIHGI
jgi:hypothetical protein